MKISSQKSSFTHTLYVYISKRFFLDIYLNIYFDTNPVSLVALISTANKIMLIYEQQFLISFSL